MAVPGLNPTQAMQFQQTRNNASRNLLSGRAQNLYQRQLADIALRQNVRDFTTDQDRRRIQLPQSYMQRGVGRSGIYQGALKNYATDRLAGLARLQNQHQLGQQGMVFSDRGLEDDYWQTMANSYIGQYGVRADLASKLRGIL